MLTVKHACQEGKDRGDPRLSKPETQTIGPPEQTVERNAAFDLLDALTRSGALPVEACSLHVGVAATHGFDRTLADTVSCLLCCT